MWFIHHVQACRNLCVTGAAATVLADRTSQPRNIYAPGTTHSALGQIGYADHTELFLAASHHPPNAQWQIHWEAEQTAASSPHLQTKN